MAEMRFSTFNGSGTAMASPGYTNRGYLTTEKSPHSVDVSYYDGGGGVQYSREYRTEVRTIESSKPAEISVDLSSPFSLGGNGSFDVDIGYGYAVQEPRSPGAASAGSRSAHLVSQAEHLDYRTQQRLPPPPPPPDLDDYANLPPQQQRYEYSTTTSSRQVTGGAAGRLGSASNLSAPRSPQYVNGIGGGVGGGGGFGLGYDYSVSVETNRLGSRPSAGGSLHASQASGLDLAGRQQQQQQVVVDQHQYVNYRELRDESDGAGYGGGVTLSRSDKFGSLGSLNGARIGANASLTLRSQGSASGGGGGSSGGAGAGAGFGLSVRDIDLHEESSAAAMFTMRQETRQQTQTERSVTQKQTQQVETVDSGMAGFRDPTMADLIAYLRLDNDQTVLHATAFIQHITFADNYAKVEFFRLGGLPRLIALLQAAVGGGRGGSFDLLRNLLGIVRNVTFRSNDDDELIKHREPVSDQKLDELKFELVRLGVLKLLSEVIANSRDEESREIACAAVWNISSTPSLKPDVIDNCAQTLVQTVLLPHSGLELRGESYVSVHQPMHNTFLFYLASGVLRSVSSTPGEQWRNRLRQATGLPDSIIWPLLSAQASQLEMNQPGLENCLCTVRNLAFACQEVVDSNYLRRQQAAAAAAAAGPTAKKSPLACCGPRQPKDQKQQQQQPKQKQPAGGSKPAASGDKGKAAAAADPAPIIQRRMPNPMHGMDRIWSPADMAPLLLHLLDTCQRPHMFEAAAGAVQNLAACSWQPAVDFRKQFRSLNGHQLLCQLVAEAQPPLWPAVVTLATAYRNLLQDSASGQVTAQQAQLLASILPPAPTQPQQPQQASAGQPRRPADQQAAVIAALFAALRREPGAVAEELFRCGAVASLVHISGNPAGNTENVVRFADALLAFLASSGEGAAYKNRLRDDFGWSGPHKSGQQQKQQQKQKTAAGASGSAAAAGQKKTQQQQQQQSSAAAGAKASGGASGGAGISISISGPDARGNTYENSGYQTDTIEMRTASEPQYAQINRGDRNYGYSTTKTTTKTTTMVQNQNQQQQQQQQQHQLQDQQAVADSWV